MRRVVQHAVLLTESAGARAVEVRCAHDECSTRLEDTENLLDLFHRMQHMLDYVIEHHYIEVGIGVRRASKIAMVNPTVLSSFLRSKRRQLHSVLFPALVSRR